MGEEWRKLEKQSADERKDRNFNNAMNFFHYEEEKSQVYHNSYKKRRQPIVNYDSYDYRNQSAD